MKNTQYPLTVELNSSAPELLAALQNLQKRFVQVSEHFARKEGRIWVYGAQENCAALNAIKKATGGQS